ncbi:MAG: HNH endonuclease [Candidatus Thorarchaeota archaeon]|jgi:hypothetical protein
MLKLIDTISLDKKNCHTYYKFRKLRKLLGQQKNKCALCSAFAFEIGLYYNTKNNAFEFKFHTIDSNGNFSFMTIDHIIPKSKSGKNKIPNLQILCNKCNSRKGAKL